MARKDAWGQSKRKSERLNGAPLKGEELEEELTSSRNCELTMDVIYVYRSEQEDTRNA